MQLLPATSGLGWLRDGFALWRRQPSELSLLFLLYVTLNLFVSVMAAPLGVIATLLLGQVFVTAFMLGCAEVDAGRNARPRMLFAYLRHPALARLIGLGLCYLVAVFIAVGVTYLYAGGGLADVVIKARNSGTGMVDEATSAAIVRAMFLGMSVYTILVLPLWFAGPLIAWQDMGVAKAIFFSVMSVLRAIKAFIALILAWTAIWLFVAVNVGVLLSLLPGGQIMQTILALPCSIMLYLLGYCTFYPSYVELFGKPTLPERNPD